MEERDKWEEIIRSKLKDFEVDTPPDDWKAIESRISSKKVVLSRRWYYAAAVITLFLLITGGYYYFINNDEAPIVAMQIGETANNDELRITNYEAGETANNDELQITNYEIGEANNHYELPMTNYEIGEMEGTDVLSLLPHSPIEKLEVKYNQLIPETLLSLKNLLTSSSDVSLTDDLLYADATPLKSNKSGRRWTIGAGGGSYSVGTNGGGFASLGRNNTISSMAASSNGEWYMDTPRRNDNFNDFLAKSSNLVSENNETTVEKIDISHKHPISLGIGVGYVLNDRWSLQSGLVYSMLSSEWKTNYQDNFKQQLHFLGVPLSLSYKIAEWNKFHFYASTGGMVDWNVSGNIKTKTFFTEDNAYRTEKESVRMKELQLSVNARVGATYPLIKFINAYIEGGTNYYFDNHSSIETIRSDKPFHVSLQAGLRFGF